MAGYITELSKNVERTHVRYNNRYGIAIAADLYTPKDLKESQKYPALIVGAPYGGVKEQGPRVYANELAQRGFVVLTFTRSIWASLPVNPAGSPPRTSSLNPSAPPWTTWASRSPVWTGIGSV